MKDFGNYPSESWLFAEDRILSIINTSDTSSAGFREKIYQWIYDISALGYSVKAGIGSVAEHLGQSGVSYSSAVEALSYRIYDTDAVLFDSAAKDLNTASLSSDKIDCKPLIYALTHQHTQEIADYVDSFFEVLFADQLPPPNYVAGRCMYLLINVQKQLALLYPDIDFDIELSYEKFYQFDSVQSLHEWVTHILVECSGMLAVASSEKNGIIRTAKEYVMNNLDKNIKAKDVADQVHLSESYFSIYFKEKTGINFRDFILNARISTALKLLKSQDINISEIAYRVGYGDYRSFSRAFKNETGMTPSEYQNSM
jgi:two-component system response regulator YesN